MTEQYEGIVNPPIDSLLERVDSKYALVLFAAKRARQIDQGVEHLLGGGVDGEAVLPRVEPALERARLPGDAVAGRFLGGGLELLTGQPRGLGDGVQHLGESPAALHEHVVHGPVRGALEHREGLGRGHPLAQHEVPRPHETAVCVPGSALERTGGGHDAGPVQAGRHGAQVLARLHRERHLVTLDGRVVGAAQEAAHDRSRPV